MCLYIFVFLFLVTAALKLGPLYIQDRNITSALNALPESMHGEITVSGIKDRLSKTFQVSMIDETILKDLTIDNSGSDPVLMLNYDAQTKFIANIDVVIHFKHTITLPSH
jgi:hypothetical protein